MDSHLTQHTVIPKIIPIIILKCLHFNVYKLIEAVFLKNPTLKIKAAIYWKNL